MTANMIRHPRTGEIYAYRTDDDGVIVEATGPVTQEELDAAVDPVTALDAILDSVPDDDLEDDAEWLRRELGLE